MQSIYRNAYETLHLKSTRLSSSSIVQHLLQMDLLSSPFKDIQERVIEILRTPQDTLVGTVLDEKGHLIIIPENRIKNGLNPQDEHLCGRLKNAPCKQWDLVFDTKRLIITIWPHLEAAGRYDKVPIENVLKDVKERYTSVTKVHIVGADGSKVQIENHRKFDPPHYVKTEGGAS